MLAYSPNHGPQIKILKGVPSCYRLRVNQYRVLYRVIKKKLVVEIIHIGHRREVYR